MAVMQFMALEQSATEGLAEHSHDFYVDMQLSVNPWLSVHLFSSAQWVGVSGLISYSAHVICRFERKAVGADHASPRLAIHIGLSKGLGACLGQERNQLSTPKHAQFRLLLTKPNCAKQKRTVLSAHSESNGFKHFYLPCEKRQILLAVFFFSLSFYFILSPRSERQQKVIRWDYTERSRCCRASVHLNGILLLPSPQHFLGLHLNCELQKLFPLPPGLELL